ncbi:MAG: IS110 family transposase [Egibacteraceae bacterium]
MIFAGIDWAEDHHDLCVLDPEGRPLAARRAPEGLDGVALIHELVAGYADDPGEVVIGIETDRGLLVGALLAAGYQLYAVNPLAAARYRDRHTVSGAKSDKGDAKLLADLVRTDRCNHRPIAADSDLLEAVKVLARSHQSLIWARQRQTNQLRSTLRELCPGALVAFDDLDHPDALAVLAKAPTPEQGKALSVTQIAAALRRSGRRRNIDRRAAEIRDALRLPQLAAAPLLTDASGVSVAALVPVITTLGKQIAAVEARLIERFDAHPDAELLLSLPGLGHVLGARVRAELGDAPNRHADARARRDYAGAAPVTRQSGTSKIVSARFARNSRLFDALWQWAFCALSASPGARAYYDAHNPGPHTSKTARRKLANKLVGVLHGCLTHGTAYDEQLAWANWTGQSDLAA